MSNGSKIAIGCVVLTLLGCVLSCCGFFAWASVGKQGGVRYANNPEQYASEYIEAHHLLEADEHLVAYYDLTLELDASEMAILTDRRVLYTSLGNVQSIPLSEIQDVTQTDQGPMGTLIMVHGASSIISIEVAPFNGAEGLFVAITRAWRDASPAVVDVAPVDVDAGTTTADAGADSGAP